MSRHALHPSVAWLDEVFRSSPRRDIAKASKTTTRIPVHVPLLNKVMYAEGGHEATALYLLKHLHQHGLVRRFKAQAFDLEEIGGPRGRIPDLLVELYCTPSLHVVQCKAKRFVSSEIQDRYEEEKVCLQSRGFQFHSWTDRDRLSNPTSQSVRLIDRGLQLPITHSRLADIQNRVSATAVLGELLRQFGWDDTIAAAAQGLFFLDVTAKIHENTPILHHFPRQKYEHLFIDRPISGDFWDTLAP